MSGPRWTALVEIMDRETRARELARRYCRRIVASDRRSYAAAYMARLFDGGPSPSEQGVGEVPAWRIRGALRRCKDMAS